MARLSEHGIRLSSMSPSFLNSNSTSHTWPFSAVAELIDNASDPGVSAKQIWIDVVKEAGHHCLTFTDNGSGMTPNKLHKMLSFGFTEKGSGKASQQAIGLYGNGFKSGSMRLGRDALIFTKNGGCQTVGMLSQTYLENIKAQAVIVPIVPFNQQTKSLVVTEDSEASLAAILQNSIITSQEKIHAHFESILSKKGTKILIWNIRRGKDAKPEIDFDADESDFRLPEIQIGELRKGMRSNGSLRAEQNVPEMHYSLRAYLSILYLKPRTQVILRGKRILAQLVAKRLKHIEHDVYKPHFSKEKVKVTFGLNLKNKDHYGVMMYHKNRLIKAYEKVGYQLKTSGQRAGVGIIGVIECNFLKPAHNKQDFEYTKEYRLTLGALGLKLNDYWKEMTEKKAREREFQALDRDENGDVHDTDEAPMWVQCGECLKWRSVPAGHYTEMPDSWNCSQNPNPRYRSCSSPEEAEDNDELLTPSYQKNHKKQEHPRSRKREKSLELSTLEAQAAKHQILSRSASEPNQPTFQSPHTPDPSCTDVNSDTHTHDDAQTHSTHTQQKPPPERDTFIQDKTTQRRVVVEKETDDEEGALQKHVEMKEGEESTCTISLKWKPAAFDYSSKKKPRLSGEEQPGSVSLSDNTTPGKQANTPKTIPTENTRQCGSSQGDKPDDKAQGSHTSHTWTHPLPPTQTLMVSPLNLTEGPRSRPPPREGNDREANMQKLAGLEKEVQRLRRLLGPELTRTRIETMAITDGGSEKTRGQTVGAPAFREVGCQTDVAESSSSISSYPTQSPGPQGLLDQSQTDLSGRSFPSMEKTEPQSDPYEDSRSAQENLLGVRNNVVLLLTALLPQLDLAGISTDTSDVDNILQQIIEVNSLKL